MSVTIAQTPFAVTMTLEGSGPPLDVDVAPLLPLGAARVRAQVAGRNVELRPAGHSGAPVDTRASVRLRTGAGPTTVRFDWAGGLSVTPVFETPLPGQRSTHARVLDVRSLRTRERWVVDVAGPAGRTAVLDLAGVARPGGGGARRAVAAGRRRRATDGDTAGRVDTDNHGLGSPGGHERALTRRRRRLPRSLTPQVRSLWLAAWGWQHRRSARASACAQWSGNDALGAA